MEDKNNDDLDAVRKVVDALKSFAENDQRRIIRWASEKLNISIETEARVIPPSHTPASGSLDNALPQGKAVDIKTFVEKKQPKGDNQFATTVAYFYRFEALEADRKESISKKDLEDATRLANWKRIGRPDQVLVNATKSGLLDNISRGQYRLNSVGENLVAMVLPGGETPKRAKPKREKKRRTR